MVVGVIVIGNAIIIGLVVMVGIVVVVGLVIDGFVVAVALVGVGIGVNNYSVGGDMGIDAGMCCVWILVFLWTTEWQAISTYIERRHIHQIYSARME